MGVGDSRVQPGKGGMELKDGKLRVQNEMTFHNSVPAVLSVDGTCHIMVFNSSSLTNLGTTLVAI